MIILFIIINVLLSKLNLNRVTSNINNVSLDVTLGGLNDSESETLNLIKTNPKITREDIAAVINKNIRTVQRIDNSLVAKGYLIDN